MRESEDVKGREEFLDLCVPGIVVPKYLLEKQTGGRGVAG
jgi:hypothetical protein